MDRNTVEAVLKLVNNSTSNSLNQAVRQVYFAERTRLASLLKLELDSHENGSDTLVSAPPGEAIPPAEPGGA
jgi:hypothetical protein